MFGGKKKENKVEIPESFTLIDQGTIVQGNIDITGRIQIHGIIKGNLNVNGVVEVAESGLIEGEYVKADEVKIVGHVKANIDAKGRLEIWKRGKLEGNVRAGILDIEEGAIFIGSSNMGPSMDNASLPETTKKELEEKKELFSD